LKKESSVLIDVGVLKNVFESQNLLEKNLFGYTNNGKLLKFLFKI